MALKRAGVVLVAEGYSLYLQQLQNVNKAQRDVFKNLPDQARKVGPAMRDASEGTESFARGLLNLGNIIKASVIGFLITALLKLKAFADASSDIATRSETLGVTLETVGKAAGYTGDQVAYAIEQLKEQGITTQAAQQSLIRMTRANISWAEASKLAAIAQGSAVSAGMTSSDAFNRLVLGIQKREPELLDELGITLRRGDAYKKLAAQLGKNVDELSDQEQMQAILNEVYHQSAGVLDVYKNAMNTAGKQEGSLTRLIEETQLNLGNLLLPLRSASVAMETDFWKGARKATLGLALFGPVLQDFLTDLGLLGRDVNKEVGILESAGDEIGKRWQGLIRNFVEFSAILGGALTGAAEAVRVFLTGASEGIGKFLTGDFVGAAEAAKNLGTATREAFQTTYVENTSKKLAEYHQKFPALWQDWKTLSEVAEVSLERQNTAVDNAMAGLEDQKAALEKQVQVMQQVEATYDRFSQAVANENENFTKQMTDLDKQLAVGRMQLEERVLKDLDELERKAAEDRANTLEEYNRESVEAERDRQFQIAQARRKFDLEQMQSQRRFQLSERRLMAEGDVLGIQQLREDFELQKKEEKEGFNEQQRTAAEASQEEERKRRESMEQRLRELDEDVKKRREQIMTSYEEELQNLIKANAEQKAQAQIAHQERLDDLKQARDKELEELGRSLQREGEVTEEGMRNISEILAKVFGEQGAGDALIKGWTDRSTTAVSDAMKEIQEQIVALDAQINALSEEGAAPPRQRLTAPNTGPFANPVGMRTGGIGVVTGPATFEVEPGVRELAAFVPLRGQQNLNVNVGGGIDVRGAQGASPFVVDAAVAMTMEEIRAAFRNLAKR